MPNPLIKVASPSFSRNEVLRDELCAAFPGAVFNERGERLAADALARFLADAEGAVIGLEPVDERALARAPGLRSIAKFGVGLDNIDLEACARRGIAVGWTAGVNRLSVAEMTLAFMIGLSRNLFFTAFKLRQGLWDKSGGRQLSGRTVGIIGLGNVGKEVARLLQPFRCRILANDIVDQRDYCQAHGLEPASKDEIYASADIVTLHVPLTEETRRLVDEATLARFRPGAYLVNTSRGEVVCERALKRALAEGSIGGAAIDVFVDEPPADLEFLSLPNLACTPHIGGNAAEAVLAMGRSAIAHLGHHFAAAEPAAALACAV